MNSQENDLRSDPIEEPIVISATQARQGVMPHVTRYVLGWGMGLVSLAFVLIYIFQR